MGELMVVSLCTVRRLQSLDLLSAPHLRFTLCFFVLLLYRAAATSPSVHGGYTLSLQDVLVGF